jgi:hypothetical protein
MCWSTDFKRTGYVDLVPIQSITSGWNQEFRGWTEDINGVTVYAATAALPVVVLANIIHAVKTGATPPEGVLLKKAVAAEVGRGVMNLDKGKLGMGFKLRYKLVQKKYLESQGVPVTDRGADGVPGRSSLTWLGKRRGFNVE